MPEYRRNRLLEEKVERDATFGLPLFGKASTPSARMMESAPASIALATDTRKLSHILMKFNKQDLNRKQRIVFGVIKEHGPVTNEEINKILGWNAINRVVGRTFELRSYGMDKKALVVFAGKRACSVTGNVASTWMVNE
jgi:hypothetical protein